ncbi:flagellin [Dryocola sp. BD626]|uniref:flagellin N-terminal helical domain-containing protein n=1 Tax=Dryocola sp. BD626 TaxID=3133273 RepID=UPI003F4FEA23
MAQVINTNSLSLMAQTNLNKSQASLGTAIQRLSSGLRINSAKDDAAGQAITNRFTANIEGMTQAARNANDGISLAQTTEGALNEINDNVLNIRRLTEQALNGTNSDSDRKSIQEEIDARLQEIGRIAADTEFNGVNVLDGSTSQLKIQIGAKDGQTIDIDLPAMDLEKLGLDNFSVTGALNKGAKLDKPTLTASGVEAAVGDKISAATTGGALTEMNLDANALSEIAKAAFEDPAKEAADITLFTIGTGAAMKTYAMDKTSKEAVEVKVTADDSTGDFVSAAKVSSLSSVDADILLTGTSTVSGNGAIYKAGNEITVSGATAGDTTAMKLTAENLDDIAVAAFGTAESAANMQLFGTTDSAGKVSYYAVHVDENGNRTGKAVDLKNDAGTFTATAGADMSTKDFQKLEEATLPGVTAEKLETLDKALAQVDSFRSGLGAVQNRFGSIISNLNTTINNMTEARSRILDADFSSEVSAMSRANILQQAGVTVLGQANQVPQNVLSLLR